MTGVLVKAVGIWLIMVVAAILNGLMRGKLLTPLVGGGISLPVSGIVLSIIVLLVAYFTIPFVGVARTEVYLLIGLLWVVLTLAFEYLFGHYVAGKSWHEINQVFNLAKGDLFVIVIVVSAMSPWIVAKLRGLV